jgi:hypothetical protein
MGDVYRARVTSSWEMEPSVVLLPDELDAARHPGRAGEALPLGRRGKGLHLRVNRLDLRGALAYFQQAVERDPSFAAAHVGVAEVQAILCAYTTLPPREGIAVARQSLERASALGGESAEQLYVEALIALSYDKLKAGFDERSGLFVFSGWPFQRRLRHEPLMQRLSRHPRDADRSVFML